MDSQPHACGAGCLEEHHDDRGLLKKLNPITKPYRHDPRHPSVVTGVRRKNPLTVFHRFKKTVDGEYICPNCPKVFVKQNTASMHILMTHSPPEYFCASCSKVCGSTSILRNHYKNIHMPKGPEPIISCKYSGCSKTFKNQNGAWTHFSRKHLDLKKHCVVDSAQRYKCRYCQQRPLKCAGFLVHLARDHADEAVAFE